MFRAAPRPVWPDALGEQATAGVVAAPHCKCRRVGRQRAAMLEVSAEPAPRAIPRSSSHTHAAPATAAKTRSNPMTRP